MLSQEDNQTIIECSEECKEVTSDNLGDGDPH